MSKVLTRIEVQAVRMCWFSTSSWLGSHSGSAVLPPCSHDVLENRVPHLQQLLEPLLDNLH